MQTAGIPSRPAVPPEAMADREKLDLYVGLFKFYLELMLKVDVFIAAIVGGIMAFGMTTLKETSYIGRIGLFMVPAGISLALAIVTGRYISSTREMHAEIQRIGEALGLTPPPHVKLLVDVTLVSCIAYFLLCAGIVFVALSAPFELNANPK